MNQTAAGPAGLLVLHLWTEPVDRLRVRATSTVGVGGRRTTTVYAASEGEVHAIVHRWLDEVVRPPVTPP